MCLAALGDAPLLLQHQESPADPFSGSLAALYDPSKGLAWSQPANHPQRRASGRESFVIFVALRKVMLSERFGARVAHFCSFFKQTCPLQVLGTPKAGARQHKSGRHSSGMSITAKCRRLALGVGWHRGSLRRGRTGPWRNSSIGSYSGRLSLLRAGTRSRYASGPMPFC